MTKKVLIRVDKVAIKNTKERIITSLELLNQFVELTEDTIKTTFSDKEKIALKEGKIDFIKSYLKPKFMFPDASEEFNLNALGIDLKPIQDFLKTYKSRLDFLNPELKNGRFVIDDIDNLPEVKKYYYYATNDSQLKAYEEAKEVCKHLNALLDSNAITHSQSSLVKYFKNIRYGTESNIFNPKEMFKFYPNEVAILKY